MTSDAMKIKVNTVVNITIYTLIFNASDVINKVRENLVVEMTRGEAKNI